MNNDNPEVSIIVPIYNAEDYIDDTIQAVLNQSYCNWELLLIDDGSTDQTKRIIKKYVTENRIRYFYKENGGQGSARNLGIRMSKGFYLAFLDADDLWDPNKLEVQLKVFSNRDVSLVFSRLKRIDHNGTYLNSDLGSGNGIYEGFRTLFLLAAGSITIPNSSVMATKESILRAGCFNEKEEIRNIEDYVLWFRMLMAGSKFYGLSELVGSYRKHQDQSSYSDSGQDLKLINYLENMSREYPEKRTYFEFLIIHRLSLYIQRHGDKTVAKNMCLKFFFSNSCIHSYWFEKYFIKVMNLKNYLTFRELLTRRFRRYKTFVELIND